jgi:hypothetical protein
MLKPKPQITHLAYDKQVAAMAEWIRESVSPFDGDTKATQAARLAATEADFLLFCTTYLPHYFATAWGAFHTEWFALSQAPDSNLSPPPVNTESQLSSALPYRYTTCWLERLSFRS